MYLRELSGVELGTAPCNEECGQSGYPYGTEMQKLECQEFKDQIERELGAAPEGTAWRAKSNPHEFGSYYELVLKYDYEDEAHREYATRVEDTCPMNWDETAKANLEAKGYFKMKEENGNGRRG